MAVVMDKSLSEKIEKIKQREWWPVAALAGVLGKPKLFIYRKISDGKFDVLNDGGYVKVISRSVINYFSEQHHQIS